MKRWLFLMTALLALSGCAAETEYTAPTTEHPSTISSTEEPTAFRAPGSMLEVSTSGSLQVYPLNRTDCSRIAALDGGLLVFSGLDATTLTLLTGDQLQVSAEVTLDCAIDPNSPAVQISKRGVTYYDETSREIVFLDKKIEEFSRIALPETIVGSPALTADQKTVYYCTADSLRSIDLESGIDKLLKEMSYHPRAVIGLHCDETVLQCTAADDSGTLYSLFLSTLTGETLHRTAGEMTLSASGRDFFAIRQDGAYTELLVGSGENDVHLLSYEDTLSTAASVPELGGAVLTFTYEKEKISRLDLYDLSDGTLSASVNIPGTDNLRSFLGDGENQCVWFLRYDGSLKCDILCRWDMTRNTVEDDTNCLIDRPTAKKPDAKGLERCAETAASLSEAHGVEILIWTDIAACQNEGASLTVEYQVPLIQRSLEQLENALSCYPKGFLTQAAAATNSGILKICLVRSVGSGETGLQYWTDDSVCIALCPADDLEQNFHHQLFFILENRVLGNCNAYDNWNYLNPKGFSYTLDDTAATDAKWLEDEDRAFIDSRSMSFPREDRATIMEYAITPGNRDCFASDTMQKKLHKLCTGIRKAFDLEDSEETFLWEQYLNK